MNISKPSKIVQPSVTFAFRTLDVAPVDDAWVVAATALIDVIVVERPGEVAGEGGQLNGPAARLIYCTLDYGYTPIPEFAAAGRHRTTADPFITRYKSDYYLFSTN